VCVFILSGCNAESVCFHCNFSFSFHIVMLQVILSHFDVRSENFHPHSVMQKVCVFSVMSEVRFPKEYQKCVFSII